MTNQIVSANYLDRHSNFKWLLRGQNEIPQYAHPFKTVKATGVKFKRSTHWEEGFGCTRVAFCESAEGSNDPMDKSKTSKLIKLHFDGDYSFINESTNEPVDEAQVLYLDENGNIWAEIMIPKSC